MDKLKELLNDGWSISAKLNDDGYQVWATAKKWNVIVVACKTLAVAVDYIYLQCKEMKIE